MGSKVSYDGVSVMWCCECHAVLLVTCDVSCGVMTVMCVCRQLKLSETPHSLCFCSERGDLLVGIGKHIHKINYQSCE